MNGDVPRINVYIFTNLEDYIGDMEELVNLSIRSFSLNIVNRFGSIITMNIAAASHDFPYEYDMKII
jgi:hypothetical protein